MWKGLSGEGHPRGAGTFCQWALRTLWQPCGGRPGVCGGRPLRFQGQHEDLDVVFYPHSPRGTNRKSQQPTNAVQTGQSPGQGAGGSRAQLERCVKRRCSARPVIESFTSYNSEPP